jgi:hypothetical protein
MPVGVYHLDMALTGAAPEPSNRPKSPLAVLLPYTTVGVLLAALYVAWTFYSRHESTRKAEEAAQMEKERARKRVVDQVYGSGEVRFSIFSAGSAAVRRGERTQLCYGVVNANTVKIEPSVGEELKPTYRHCIEIRPPKTTTYTITASNEKGESKSESLTVQVR